MLAAATSPLRVQALKHPSGRGKIVVDATNNHDAPPEVMAGRLSSDIVAKAMPGASVVKAFNQLPAGVLIGRDPPQDGGRRVVFIASNDDKASATTKSLAEQLGFSPILMGRIDEGGRLLYFPGPLALHNLIEFPSSRTLRRMFTDLAATASGRSEIQIEIKHD
jgi:8-hydroxy-5-deazaflavin:NADPH oxidoreductase